jgi:hypothetical protein
MIRQRVKQLSIIAFIAVIASCKKDDDQPSIPQPIVNEPESITSVELQFTSVDGISSFTAKWDDPDGLGGNEPLIDTIQLDSGVTYNVEVSFLDRSSGTSVDLTSEIEEEAAEHIICYALDVSTENTLEIASTDSDGNYRIGLKTQWQAKSLTSGELTLTLKHQPDGIKNGTCEPGETDVEVLFPLSIE